MTTEQMDMTVIDRLTPMLAVVALALIVGSIAYAHHRWDRAAATRHEEITPR